MMLQWRNGNWGGLYYLRFYTNMLRAHVKKIDGFKNKQTEETRIRLALRRGEVVKVNGSDFRLKHERKEHGQGQAAEQTVSQGQDAKGPQERSACEACGESGCSQCVVQRSEEDTSLVPV